MPARRSASLLGGLAVAGLTGCPDGTPPPPPAPPPAWPAPTPPRAEQPAFPPVDAQQGPPAGGDEDEPWDGGPVTPVAPPPLPVQQPDPPVEREPVRDGPIARFPGIRIFVEEKRLEVDGFICMKRGPALELMGCTRRGKTHESLVLFECEPEQLYLSLILLGLEPTPQVDSFGQPIALERGERVVLELEWAGKDDPSNVKPVEGEPQDEPRPGEPPPETGPPAPMDGRVRRRVEDLIWDRAARGPMPRAGWVFTGSRHVDVPAPPDWKETMKVFAATYAGNVAATYHDPDAILDTPLLEGGDDTAYLPYGPRLPERGTEVVIHVRPWRDEDGPPLPRATPRAGTAPVDTATPPGSSSTAPVDSPSSGGGPR